MFKLNSIATDFNGIEIETNRPYQLVEKAYVNVMYFSSGSVPQYDINNLINSTQNKLNL